MIPELTQSMVYIYVAAAVTILYSIFALYEFHSAVVSFASYPKDIYFNGTYFDKAKYTLSNRLKLTQTILFNLVALVILVAVAVTLSAGLIHLLA